MAIEKVIGPYSAYAIAVKHGFVGTEEEWIKLLKDAELYGALAQKSANLAEESKVAAKKSEEAAAKTLLEVTGAKALALEEIETQKESSIEEIDEAGNGHVEAINKAVENAVVRTEELKQASAEQIAVVEAAGNAQVQNVNAAGATQIAAIEVKGAETLETIPADYTKLAQDVSSLKDTKAPAIECEASGSIITVDDAAAMPVRELVSQIVPYQAGRGDPSHDNIRPIAGWAKVNAVCTRKNLYGGLYLANDFASKINNCKINTDAKTVYYTAQDISGKLLYNSFKPDTQYTAIITLTAESTGATTNMRLTYTDGTVSDAFRLTDTADGKRQAVFVSAAGKSVDKISGVLFGGSQYLLYEESGVFEGVLTAEDFEPYEGEALSADLPEPVYGGSLDWKTGVLTVDWKYIQFDGVTTDRKMYATDNAAMNEDTMPYAYLSKDAVNPVAGKNNAIANILPSDSRPFSRNCISCGNTLSVRLTRETIGFVEGDTKDSVVQKINAVLKAWYDAGTPLEVAVKVTDKQTYQLTPPQMDMLKGYNNVWSDCGDTSIVYCADTKDWGKGASVALIGATENSMVATKNYSSGDFIVNKETLSMYRATKAIATGEAIAPGTNCAATTVVEQLAALYTLINA